MIGAAVGWSQPELELSSFFFSVSRLAGSAPGCVLAHVISSLALKFAQPNEDPRRAAANKSMTTAPFCVYSLSHEFNQTSRPEIEL